MCWTNDNATTRLASVALERVCQSPPEQRVLDFGSGTGVLAFVALFSGASTVWGVDIDPVSVEASQHNATLNGLSDRANFTLPSALLDDSFDVVVANLEAPTLLSCAPEILRRAARARRVVLTGFLADRSAEMAAAFAPWAVERSLHEEDWALLELVPQAGAK